MHLIRNGLSSSGQSVRIAHWVTGLGLFSLLLQAALLAVSLVSITDGANLVPPWLAIVAAVGGLLLVAGGSWGVARVRTLRRAFAILEEADRATRE